MESAEPTAEGAQTGAKLPLAQIFVKEGSHGR
jgi:hypothetical protein